MNASHKDPHNHYRVLLPENTQCDGCELRNGMRENKIVPFVPPGVVCARLFCARTGANSRSCTDARTFEDSGPVGSASEGKLGLSSYLTGGSRCTSFCGISSLLSFSRGQSCLLGRIPVFVFVLGRGLAASARPLPPPQVPGWVLASNVCI